MSYDLLHCDFLTEHTVKLQMILENPPPHVKVLYLVGFGHHVFVDDVHVGGCQSNQS